LIDRSKALFLDFVSLLGVDWTQRPCQGILLWLILFKGPSRDFVANLPFQAPKALFWILLQLMLLVICRGGLYFFQCLPRCLFGYFICFSQLGLLVFSFYLSDSVDYFHNSLFLTDSIFLRFVDFVFCSLLINTTFCSFTWFCTFIVTCNYVITSTLILFKAHFYLKVVITEEGLWPKCFLLNFLIFFLRQKLSVLTIF